MNRLKTLCLLALLFPLAAARPGRADPPPADVLSPALKTALQGLSAEDYKAREKALTDLQRVLAQQLQAILATDDPESQSRLAALLEFNDGISRWAIEALKLPDQQRQAQLKWGLSPKALPAIAKLYSASDDRRVEGVRDLARMDDPEVSFVLARLLDDPERAVYLAAMEAVWDRKPTDAVVNSLWNRAVEAGFAAYNPAPVVVAGGVNVAFRGRIIGGAVYDNALYRRMQDHQIATDVLVNLKAPQLTPKLQALFEKADQALSAGDPNGRMWMYMAQSEPMKNAYRLVEAYKTKEIVPLVYHIATARITSRSQGQFGNEKYFWSNRTAALAAVVRMTDQNAEDYKLRKLTQIGSMWCVPTEADENAGLVKLKAWWQKNSAAFGGKLAPAEAGAAATQPATAPAAEGPVPAAVPLPAGVRIQNLQIQGGGQIQIQGQNVQIEIKGQ
jgi:hypothetical protein